MAENTRSKNAIKAAIDLFNRRYVLRILWELREETLNFRALQTACNDISPSTLNLRLSELRASNLICHIAGEGYALSSHGRSLALAALPLQSWVLAWHSNKISRKTSTKPAPKSGVATKRS